jgi:hypothetical protein
MDWVAYSATAPNCSYALVRPLLRGQLERLARRRAVYNSPDHDRFEVKHGDLGRRRELESRVVRMDHIGDVGKVRPSVGFAGDVERLLGVLVELTCQLGEQNEAESALS